MFFLYALLSVLAYSVHNALMAPIYREVEDKLSVVFYRGICIGISFAPALFLVPVNEILNYQSYLPLVIVASILAVVGTWAAVNSVNYLAIGIANTLLNALSNIFIVLVSVIFLGEILNRPQITLIVLILLSVLALGFGRSSGTLPLLYNPKKGFLFCLLFAVFTGSAYVLLGTISKTANPILIGYAWESLIGVSCGVLLLIRSLAGPDQNRSLAFLRPEFQLIKRIFFCSAPAGIATAFYALAMSHGSIAIASAVLNLCMVLTTIISVVLYGERLSRFQWGILFVLCLLVSALKFVV